MGKNLYVGNLPYSTSEDDLQALFADYGPSSIRIAKDRETGRSKGFAFVEFEDEANAERALEKNGTELDGRSITVAIAQERDNSGQKGNKLYVGNLSYDMDDGGLTALFEKYGPMSSASVIRDRETGQSKGFGFVEFENVDDAEKALEVNGTEQDGRKIVVRYAQPKR